MNFKSQLEQKFHQLHPQLPYETTRLPFTVTHHYTPDFEITPTHFVEVKGLFVAADRQKHLNVKKQHPGIQITFVFQNPHRKISPHSKTTYAGWCEQHGFSWMDFKNAASLKI